MNDITMTQAYDVMFKNYPDVVGVKELSNMLGICSKKVYELIHSGAISVIPCGKVYKAAKISVIDYILKNNAA